MKIQLIQGEFTQREAIDIITRLIQVKIKFHESKITDAGDVETVKMREQRIKDLQFELQAVRAFIHTNGMSINLESAIQLAGVTNNLTI